MIDSIRLSKELQAGGLPGDCATPSAQHAVSGIATWHQRADGLVRIDWQTRPTAQQEAAADAVVQAHDGSEAATEAADRAAHPERTDLRTQAAAAVQAIDTYLELTNPTQAQVRDQVRLLSQATRRVIRRLVQID